MKESEAWLILAEEHDGRRTDSEFLCCSLDDYPVRRNSRLAAIPSELRAAMQERIRDALGVRFTAYLEAEMLSPWVRQARVLACLMFGQQAKDEERAR